MLFTAWSVIWIYGATGYLMLLVPVAAFVVRASYLDRPMLTRTNVIPLFAAGLIFIYLLLVDDQISVRDAGLWPAKLLVASAVFIHLSAGVRTFNSRLIGRNGLTLLVAIQRSLSLVVRMLWNVFYAFRVRWITQVGFGARWQLARGLIGTVFLELLQLTEDVRRLQSIRGKGGFATAWVIPYRKNSIVAVGDITILILALTGVLILPTVLVPGIILDLLRLH